jgi:hypothetical protein
VRPDRVARPLVAAVLAVSGASRVTAQRLTGTVTDQGARVPGAIVMLIAADGAVAGRAVSKEDGTFSVSATADGKYTIRVLRIGFRPTIAGPVDLRAAATTRRDVPLSGRVWLLPSVQVTDHGQCQVRPDTNATAFRLWDEARTALLATVLTESEPLGVRMTRDERTFDASGHNVLVDSSFALDGQSRRPIVTLPPDSLARGGYAENDVRGGTTYWGPDATVLLSESFASSHCIRPELPPADTGSLAGVLGVAFEPAGSRAARDHVEVRGVLWIDRRTAELRSLDYTYANVPSIVERAGAGGHIEFLRLPDGSWTVSRWWIRSPMIERTITREVATVPGSPPGQRTSLRLIGVHESRGDILELRRANATWWERGRVSVAIRVTDTAGAAVRAMVSLNDTSRSVATAEDGVARFDRVLPGPARVDVRVPALDSLDAPLTRAAVTIPDHPFEPIGVRVQSAQEVFAARCGNAALEWNEGAVRGRVPDASGANVEVSWDMPYARLGGGPAVVVHEARTAAVDSRGAYFVCGVPRGFALSVRVADAGAGNRGSSQPRIRRAEVARGAYVAIVDFDR